MNKEKAFKWFHSVLQTEIQHFSKDLLDENGDWIVKGFIDIYEKIYTISDDTKVVSKLIELMLFPYFQELGRKNEMEIVPCREQNHYPDLTFIHKNGLKFAVDLKSTYRKTETRANTMTLGSFTGYFRDRKTIQSTTYPYGEYSGHFVIGVIYTRKDVPMSEFKTWLTKDLRAIPSVVKDLIFFAQPKYRIAKDVPGSGNTKNIGAIEIIDSLINGTGPFAELGEDIFDDYWMNYMTNDMARSVGLPESRYKGLAEYKAYRNIK